MSLVKDIKGIFVVVGSIGLSFHGIPKISKKQEIDIVTTDINLLTNINSFGEVVEVDIQDRSPFGEQQRFTVTTPSNFLIEIFIQDTLPEYIEIDGIKIISRPAAITHYKRLAQNTAVTNTQKFQRYLEQLVA